VARRVFLHVGTPKSGTTYLQSLWWAQRDALTGQGLLVPGRARRDHMAAAHIVCERPDRLGEMTPRRRRTWQRLVTEVGEWDGDALISHELFAPATREQAAGALARLAGAAAEVHVLITARDLARQLASAWQQDVKQGRGDSLRAQWVRGRPEGSGFRRYQDVAALLECWGQGLPADRRHLVVVPPRGTGDPTWLWRHTCELLGLDPAGLSSEARNDNASIGLVETEVLRRVNAHVPEDRRTLPLRQFTKGWLTPEVVADLAGGEPFVLPRDIHHETVEEARAMVARLDGRVTVVGDLADLVPAADPEPGLRSPEDLTEAEVGEATALAMSRLVLRTHDLTR